MPGQRLSLWQLMAVVAVVAFFCLTVRMILAWRTLEGLLLPLLGIQAALLRLTFTRGRSRRFWLLLAAFLVMVPLGLLTSLAFIPGGSDAWIWYINAAFSWLPGPAQRVLQDDMAQSADLPGGFGILNGLAIELILGVPQLFLAVLAATLVAKPWRRPTDTRDVSPELASTVEVALAPQAVPGPLKP